MHWLNLFIEGMKCILKLLKRRNCSVALSITSLQYPYLTGKLEWYVRGPVTVVAGTIFRAALFFMVSKTHLSDSAMLWMYNSKPSVYSHFWCIRKNTEILHKLSISMHTYAYVCIRILLSACIGIC